MLPLFQRNPIFSIIPAQFASVQHYFTFSGSDTGTRGAFLPYVLPFWKKQGIMQVEAIQEGFTLAEKVYYAIWAVLFGICAALGNITQRNTGINIVLSFWAVLFFVPGFLLLYEGLKTGNKKLLLRLRIVCLSSLVLSLLMIMLNIFTVNAPEAVGQVMHVLLVVLSTPMSCCFIQGISLFLWACLLIASFPRIWKS